MDRDGFLGAVGLRHAGDADIVALLDVGQRRLGDAGDGDIVRHLHFALVAVARLDRQHRTIDALDGAANAQRLRLLCRCGGNRAVNQRALRPRTSEPKSR